MISTKSKKTTTKAVVKKVSPKKVVKKVVGKKSLVYADNTKSFWVHDGQILNSLVAFHTALTKMDKAVYLHHVSKEKNDFAEWIEVVLADAECALEIKKAKTPQSAKLIVARHLKTYQL
jgi:hypothetical protein